MKIADTEYYRNLTAFLRVEPYLQKIKFNEHGLIYSSEEISFSLKRCSKNNYSIICNFADLTFQYFYSSLRAAIADVRQIIENNETKTA